MNYCLWWRIKISEKQYSDFSFVFSVQKCEAHRKRWCRATALYATLFVILGISGTNDKNGVRLLRWRSEEHELHANRNTPEWTLHQASSCRPDFCFLSPLPHHTLNALSQMEITSFYKNALSIFSSSGSLKCCHILHCTSIEWSLQELILSYQQCAVQVSLLKGNATNLHTLSCVYRSSQEKCL